MSGGIDVALPLGSLAKPVIMGCPWHGRVENGELHLPNGDTRSWPQPENGDTKLIALNGVAPIARTPEQLAEDAVAGREWRNVAILSGIDNQLYGTALGRNAWIWQDAAGDRWKVTIGDLSIGSFDDGLDTHVQVERFGAFGAPSESHSRPLVLADLGQSVPVISVVSGGEMRVLDCTETGARAIVEIYVSGPSIAPPRLYEFGPSIGYLEVALSGAVRTGSWSAAATVLRTRAQTLGDGSGGSSRTIVAKRAILDYTETRIGNCPESGEVVYHTTANGYTFVHTGTSDDLYEDGDEEYHWTQSGRVIAMWYSDGVATEVAYDMEAQSAHSTVLTGSASGTQTLVVQCGSDERANSGAWVLAITQERVGEFSLRASLSVGGVVVDTLEWGESRSGSRTRHSDGSTSTFSGSYTVERRFSGFSESWTDSGPSWLYLPVFPQIWDASAGAWGTFGQAYLGLDYQDFFIGGRALGPTGLDSDDLQVAPYCYSNHAVGFILAASSGVMDVTNSWRGIACPGYFDAAVLTQTGTISAFFDPSMRRHASFNPVTGELIRDKTTPVCWV